MLYRIVRFYADEKYPRRAVKTGLYLEEVLEHCRGPESSSTTATSKSALRRTRERGAWFDGYEEDTRR